MHICELLPLKTTKKIDTLSYFTVLSVNVGDLVEINMNGQILSAIVINVASIKNSKTEIRSQDFKIKKINKIIKEKYINSELLKEIYNLSTLLGTSMNNLFNTMLPISILSEINFEKKNENKLETENNLENTFYISPTKKDVKEISKKYNTKNSTTPSLAFLCDKKINTIIINKPNSKHYYSTFKDINTKVCIEYFSKLLNIEVEYTEEENNKINISICEINKDIKLESIYLTQENFDKVKLALSENKKIALYVQRLGNSTSIACEDCKSVQKCESCDKPYILKKDFESNYLFCNLCKIKKELTNILKCDYCKSFRLLPLGIGLNGLEEYIKKEFGNDDEEKYKELKKNLKIINEKDVTTLKNIDLIIIISLDSLFAISEYNIDENIFNLLRSLSSCCKSNREFIIQTRQDKKVFDKFLSRIKSEEKLILDSEKFYKLEYKIREKNNLPPYSYVLTYESELEMPLPKFLESFNNYKIKLRTNTEKFKVNIKYINRYIYFINKKDWEENLELREKCFLNLYNYNLKINPQSILS
jgi:primosomal protein N'